MLPMKVIVKLLASYRKLLPPEVEDYKFEVEIQPGTTVAGLMSRYEVPLNKETVFLVNGRTPINLDQVLEEGDVVAAFSAMAGG